MMRNHTKRLPYLLAVVAAVAVAGCPSPPPPPPPPGNIVEVATDLPELTTLVAAINQADFEDTLISAGPYTLFAPNNLAFLALPTGSVDALLAPGNSLLLTRVLQGHVVGGELLAANLTDGQTLTTLAPSTLTVTVSNGTVQVNGSTVITPNIDASNGVIHIINKVLLLDIARTIASRSDLLTLASAITAADLEGTLSTGLYTVFAPNDAAFAALPVGVLDSLLDPGNEAALIDLLQGHVVEGLITSSGLQDGQVLTALNGDTLIVAINGNVVTINGAVVVAPNTPASNGVVHVINQVLPAQTD